MDKESVKALAKSTHPEWEGVYFGVDSAYNNVIQVVKGKRTYNFAYDGISKLNQGSLEQMDRFIRNAERIDDFTTPIFPPKF